MVYEGLSGVESTLITHLRKMGVPSQTLFRLCGSPVTLKLIAEYIHIGGSSNKNKFNLWRADNIRSLLYIDCKLKFKELEDIYEKTV